MVLNELRDLHHCIFLYGGEGVQSYHVHHLCPGSAEYEAGVLCPDPLLSFCFISLCSVFPFVLFSQHIQIITKYNYENIIVLSQYQPFLVNAEGYAVVYSQIKTTSPTLSWSLGMPSFLNSAVLVCCFLQI